ncbi:MAG: YdbH domain-containing protein [Alphaproteobacteria bacterium]|nr:YdbH domain-containing protein [Alphaproteobacteria bacterium]
MSSGGLPHWRTDHSSMTEKPDPELKIGDRLIEEETPEGRGFRRWLWLGLRSALILLIILGVLLGLGWLFRLPMANSVLPILLESVLDQPVTLKVTKIESTEVKIENFAIQNGPSIAHIDLVPNLSIADGTYLDSLTLDGIRAQMHVTEAGGTEINGLDTLFVSDTSDNTELTLPQIPIKNIKVSDIQIEATTPIGPQLLTGNLAISLDAAPSLMPMTLTAHLNAPDSQSAILATITAGSRGLVANATVDLSLAHWLPFLPGIEVATGRTTATLDMTSGPLNTDQFEEIGLPGLMAALTGSAEIAWSGASVKPYDWSTLTPDDGIGLITIEGGRLQLTLPTDIEVESGPIPDNLRHTLPDAVNAYADGNPQLTLSQTDDRPALILRPDAGGGWRTEFALDAGIALGPLSTRVTPESLTLSDQFAPRRMTLSSASIDMVRGLDLPREITGHVDIGSLAVDLPLLISSPSAHPAFDIPYQAEVMVYGDIFPPIWARSSALKSAGTAHLRQSLEGLDLTVDRGSQLKLDGLTGTGDVRLSPRLRLDVAGRDPLRVGLDFADPINSLSVEGAFRLGALSLAIPSADPPLSLELDRQPVSLRYQKGAATLAMGPVDVTVPELDASLSRAVLHIDYGGKSGTATLSADGIKIAGKPLLPGTLTASMAMNELSDGTLTVDGPISLAEGRVTASLSASHTPAGISHITLKAAPIQFGPENLALGDVVPAATLNADQKLPLVTGQIDAELDMTLTQAGQSGDLTIALDNVGVMDAEIGPKSINGTVLFDMSSPGATQGIQKLTGILSAPGLPDMPTAITFSIDPSRVVQIKEATLDLFDGEIALIDAQLDPAEVSLNGTLRLRRVDLQQALQHLEIEGVEGTGKISGLMPVRVTQGDIILNDGSLAAEGGGVLKIDNETVNQALSSDQQEVQLLSETLKDFHYDGLTATVALPAGKNGHIGLSLSGRNPAVMDGYPFQINVNLESDFRNLFQILLAFMEAYGSVLNSANLSSP